jgi:hypothetical protein
LEFSILIQFSKLVSDSSSSESIFTLLGKTVVDKCAALHALVFGTSDTGDFTVLSSYGECDDSDVSRLDLDGVCSIAELRAAVMNACGHPSYGFPRLPSH